MINFKSNEEKEIISYYADLLESNVMEIVPKDSFTEEEVKLVAKFYWDLVDISTKEKLENSEKYGNMEKKLENIYTTFHIHFNNIGFGEVWDKEIPES